ncbi:oligoendopeptidase F [Candidatus Neomarinimicrobiota bacterium]
MPINRFAPVILLLGITMTMLTSLSAQKSESVPTRDQVPIEDTWNANDIFPSDDAWEAGFKEAEGLIANFAQYEGKLGKSGTSLLAGIRHMEETWKLMELLLVYASFKSDVDLGNTQYQAMTQRIRALWAEANNQSAFIDPELAAIPASKANKFMKKTPDLKMYDFYLANLRRSQAHILPKEQEELLALTAEVTAGAGNAFGMLTNADFTWGTIKDAEGNEVEMSRGRYGYYMNQSDRRVRHDVYKELYVPFEGHINTMTSLITTKVKGDLFYAKARKYDNTLAYALDGPNIPVEVYHNLIKTVNANLEPLQRWAELKKRVLKVDNLHPYDTYAPLFPDVTKEYTFEEAQAMILEAFLPMGDKVQMIVKRAFNERWIDKYENKGKETGAYSWGAYGTHPYIKMNFDGSLSNVFTLAHELGHTIHSYLTNETQPFIYADYASFNAEVASTSNEALLRDYLLARAETDAERLSLLTQYVQDIGSTFYRQTRFAEFELAIHELVEAGEPLTREVLNQVHGDMYAKYWGPAMAVDDEENLAWSRIPHFYRNYYVYNYATSFAASQMVAKRIREEGEPAVQDFLQFLSAGGSDYPVEVLKIAGVDMSTPAPIEATTATMSNLLDQIEEILDRM